MYVRTPESGAGEPNAKLVEVTCWRMYVACTLFSSSACASVDVACSGADLAGFVLLFVFAAVNADLRSLSRLHYPWFPQEVLCLGVDETGQQGRRDCVQPRRSASVRVRFAMLPSRFSRSWFVAGTDDSLVGSGVQFKVCISNDSLHLPLFP